jgi:hypothetical protein
MNKEKNINNKKVFIWTLGIEILLWAILAGGVYFLNNRYPDEF